MDKLSDWNEGYVTDIGYIFGYSSELNPLQARLPLLNAGWAVPDWLTQGPACELGMGQGVSINMHAAASATTWYGTDFNPSQAAFAQQLASASGVDALGTRLFDEAFADFCQRSDLPDFSFIGLHGIWSWISDANRAVLADFVRRKLRVGGVLYISYNTLPGRASIVPMRDLLTEHVQAMGARGQGVSGRIDAALAFADRFMACEPGYAKANPLIAGWFAHLKDRNHNYLAHEYFNRDWQPMSFSNMARWLEPAKLHYGCSAYHMAHFPELNLTAAQTALLNEQTDPMFREVLRDCLVNQLFRRDYWVKGPRRLSTLEKQQALCAQRVMLVVPPADVVLKVESPLGQHSLNESIYAPILAALADQQPHSLGALWEGLQAGPHRGAVNFGQLTQAVMLLCGKEALVSVQEESVVQRAKPQCQRLNQYVLDRVRHTPEVCHLASPVSGGAVPLTRVELLILLALQDGLTATTAPNMETLVDYVWAAVQTLGLHLLVDGKKLESEQDKIAELQTRVAAFMTKRLPTLRNLQLVH